MAQVNGRFQKVEAARSEVQAAHASFEASNLAESAQTQVQVLAASGVAAVVNESPKQGVLRTYRKTTSGNLSENGMPDLTSPKSLKAVAPRFFSAKPLPPEPVPPATASLPDGAFTPKSLAAQLWSIPSMEDRETFAKTEAETAWDVIFDFLLDPTLFAGIEDLFRALDRDGNQRLDYRELEQGLLAAGCALTSSMVAELRNDLDENGDGTVDLNEFLKASRVHGARHATNVVLVEEAWGIVNRFVMRSTGLRKDVRELFNKIDANKDNVLTFDELSRGLRGLGLQISNDQLKAIYPDIDANKDGEISIVEWVMAIEEHCQATPEKDAQMLLDAWDIVLDATLDVDRVGSIRAVFEVADVDSDHNLSLQELARGLLSCGIQVTPRQLRLFQRDLDVDRDGSISFAEFMSKVQRFQAASPYNHQAAEEAWELAVDVLMDPARSESIMDMFRHMDSDGNMELDLDELARGVVSLGVPMTARQVRGFQKALDSNGDGSISHSEFVQAIRRERIKLEDALVGAWNKVIECTLGDMQGKVRDLFDTMDTSRDGVLDFSELTEGLRSIGANLSPRAERVFLKDVDSSGEGEVDFGEFLDGIRKYQQNSDIDPAAANEAWLELIRFLADEEAYAGIYSLFVHLDEDKSESLDLAELARGFLGLGLHLTSKQLRALHKSLDRNADGKITFQEFMRTVEDEQASAVALSWKQVSSASDGSMYWHNSLTGETSWDIPSGLVASSFEG